MTLLTSARCYVIGCTASYRKTSLYHNGNSVLQYLGDEGLTEENPQMAVKSEFLSLNKAVLVNSRKNETTKDLSSSIIYL